MKILVLNCGSSSIKYKLFDMDTHAVMVQGGVEKIGLPDAFLQIKLANGEKVKIEQPMPEHTVGIQLILNSLVDEKIGCIASLDEVQAVGHRVVHGGEKFNQSVLITPEVKEMIVKCIELAPLHNPANLKGIEAIEQTLPSVPQVAVFDTAFHQTMPEVAYTYAIPHEYYENDKVRRYGFHGTSHKYVAGRAAAMLGKDIADLKLISCHLGNGSSVTAIDGGKSVDTSMGFTPLAGLPMGTRCGDIDPAIVPLLMKKENLTADEIDTIMNKKSGLLGVSGVSNDGREVWAAADAGNERAQLAMDLMARGALKLIGTYTAEMNGLDVLVFTAGVGENDAGTRAAICEYLGFLGVKIDPELNKKRGKEMVISTPDSKVQVWVVPTNEELMIAQDTAELVNAAK